MSEIFTSSLFSLRREGRSSFEMGIGYTLSVFVVLMLLAQPVWAGFYACWGGCLNQCVIAPGKKPEKRLPCFLDCLAKCFPQPGQTYASSTSPKKIPLDSAGISNSSPASEIPGSSFSDYPDKGATSKSKFRQFGLGKKYFCIVGCSVQNCMMPNNGTSLCLSS